MPLEGEYRDLSSACECWAMSTTPLALLLSSTSALDFSGELTRSNLLRVVQLPFDVVPTALFPFQRFPAGGWRASATQDATPPPTTPCGYERSRRRSRNRAAS